MRSHPRTILPTLAALLAASGLACSHRLVPAAEAETTPGRGVGAVSTEAGVEVEARAQAWEWTPARLDRVITPVLLRIRNDSGRRLRVSYDAIALESGTQRLVALPPFDIEAEVAVPVQPYYGHHGFHVAPHLRHVYPHSSIHHGAFVHDAHYYGAHHPSLRRVELPSGDMLAHALPEGVLDSGGDATGFVYFESVGELEASELSFRLDLVDADSGEAFGAVVIPFRIE